jgi:hypothetical protein
MGDMMLKLKQGGVAERLCVRLQGNNLADSEFIRVRIPSPPLYFTNIERLAIIYFTTVKRYVMENMIFRP